MLNYPSILKFDYPPTATRSERKEYYGVLFGIGALANSSTNTTQMFNLVDGMGDLFTCKVNYNYDVVSNINYFDFLIIIINLNTCLERGSN